MTARLDRLARRAWITVPRIGPFRLLVRRSVRYLLVSRGFVILEVVCVLASLSFVLTGSRIASIDRLGNRADPKNHRKR